MNRSTIGALPSFVIAMAAAVVIVVPAAPARADDRGEIDALYGRLAQALKGKTPENILPLVTPDFTSVGASGKRSSARELIKQMKQQNAGVESVKDVNIVVKRADIHGKTAKVTTDFSYSVVIRDRDGHMGPKGAAHEMSMAGLVKNDLVKTAAGWKFQTMRGGDTGKLLVDGKPISNPPPGTVRKVKK